MSGLLYVAALLLPTLAGVAVWVALIGQPRQRSAWLTAVGAGHVLGSLGWGALLRLATPMPIEHWFAWLAPALFVTLLLAAALLRRRSALPAPVLAQPTALPPGQRWLLRGLWGVLALHTLVLLQQAWVLPPLMWDAWTVWLAKPAAWFATGHVLPSAPFAAWWEAASGTVLYSQAPAYPEALPRLLLWQAVALGAWHTPALALSWPLLWLALGAFCYGGLRLEGLRRLPALLACYALLSLPLLHAHGVFIGYADLWLAALLALVLFHGSRAFRHRSRGDAAFAVLALALLPAVKLEGAIWALCAVVAGIAALLPPRAQRFGVPLLGLILLGWAWTLGLRLPLPGLGVVELRWGEIIIPSMGTLSLHWRPVLRPVLESLFVLPNWMLLWPVLLYLLLARRPPPAARPWLRPGGWLLLSGYAFLIVLFFFTDASQWAESLTSLNRVLLHIVPATVLWFSLREAVPPIPSGRAS